MGQKGAQETMNQLKRLEASGRPYPLQAYKACKGHQQKREFAQKPSIDKECSFLEIEEKQFMLENESQEKRGGWCYLWDVARPNGISYNGAVDQVAFLKTLVKGCPQQEMPPIKHLSKTLNVALFQILGK